MLTLVLLCAPLAHAQVRTIQPQETLANLPAQKIGPRDPLAIRFYNSPELTHAICVGAELPTILDDPTAEYGLVIFDSPPLPGFPENVQVESEG